MFLVASAEDLKCPEFSRGQHPSCTCLNGGVYDATYNWCVFHKNKNGKI